MLASKTVSYFDALRNAMTELSQEKHVMFIGQAVAVDGTTMAPSFRDVPMEQRLEFPVAEDLQMGFSIGLALNGYLPVCVFPRWNFLLCAANQLVNHLDRLPLYSDGGYCPKVIIRTAVPSTKPFYPGPQHDDDLTAPFRMMLRTVHVQTLRSPDEVTDAYRDALIREGSSLLVEHTEFYKDQRAQG